MRQLSEITAERDTARTILELTSVFEGIASMRIAQIKDQVQESERFFADLWKIYSQIRVDKLFHFGRLQSAGKVINKELLLLITSGGSLSGDIDQRLVDEAIKYFRPKNNDIIVVGHHGSVQLRQKNVPYVKSYKMPERDQNINVTPLAAEVQKYANTTVFYQSYQSLLVQKVKTLKLNAAVEEKGKEIKPGEDVISEANYIFEPSTYAVVNHLERSMMQITLSEVILESKLAQYASRFRAMSTAHDKSDESLDDLTRLYNRARRHIKDERLKEVINGMKWIKR